MGRKDQNIILNKRFRYSFYLLFTNFSSSSPISATLHSWC